MRRFVVVAMAVVALVLGAWAQTSPQQTTPVHKSPLADYAGTWTGSFEGRPWMTVALTLHGEQISGWIRRATNVQFNDLGTIKSVGDTEITETVQDAKLTPDGLLLTAKDANQPDSDRFVLRLTGDTTAQLKMVAMAMPPGMPKIKPWELTRTAAATPKAATR